MSPFSHHSKDDEKRDLDMNDEKQKHLDGVGAGGDEQLPPEYVPGDGPVIVLEFRRYGKSGTQVIDTSTDEVLYTIDIVEKHHWLGHFVGFHRGGSPADLKDSKETLPPPYAVLRGMTNKLDFDGSLSPPYTGVQGFGTSKFLCLSGFLGQYSKFMSGGQEYRLKSRSWKTSDLDLVISTPKGAGPQTVLGTFEPKTSWFKRSDTRGHLKIYSSAVQTSEAGPLAQHALILDGRPTQLLDLAILAEAVYRSNERQQGAAAGASASSAASAASVAAVS